MRRFLEILFFIFLSATLACNRSANRRVDAEGVMGKQERNFVHLKNASTLSIIAVKADHTGATRYEKEVGKAIANLATLAISQLHFSVDGNSVAVQGEEIPFVFTAFSLSQIDLRPEEVIANLAPQGSPVIYPSGSLDLSFGDGTGRKLLTEGFASYATDVVIQSNGKILVGGYEGTSATVFRLNTDGTPDLGFGVQGKISDATCYRGNESAVDWAPHRWLRGGIRGLALQSDGKILLGCGGYYQGTHNGVWTGANNLVRYKVDGTLDTSFGTAGYLRVPGLGSVYNVQVGANDQIVIQGDSDGNEDSTTVTLVTLLSDGSSPSLVNTTTTGNYSLSAAMTVRSDGFLSGGGGLPRIMQAFDSLLNVLWSTAEDVGYIIRDIAVLPNGKSITASQSESPWVWHYHQYNSNGSSDNTFGQSGNGTVNFTLPQADHHWLENMIASPDGKILTGGAIRKTSDNQFYWTMLRLMPDGSYDTSFGTNGVVRLSQDSYATGVIYAMALQSDGKIVAVGDATMGRMGIFRFHP